LPHAARLAGSPYARFFTRGLALSLLQRKPDEWRRQHATPSTGGGDKTAASLPNNKNNNAKLKATAPSAIVVDPDNKEDHDEVPEGDETSSPEKERRRKKRKRRAAAMDEIDALFDDTIGRKVMRSTLEPAQASAPVKAQTNKADLASKQERGDQSVADKQAGLEAVVEAIKIAPRSEVKKRSKRRA
jgi:hypothetical protein